MISKCPACKRGVSAKETPVGQTKYLCKTHKAELDQWLEGVVGDSSPAHSSPSETQLTLQIDELIDNLWGRALDIHNSEDFANDRDYLKARANYRKHCKKELTEALQQALTSLKREMDGLKKRDSNLDCVYPSHPICEVHRPPLPHEAVNFGDASAFNDGISECQRVITEMMK